MRSVSDFIDVGPIATAAGDVVPTADSVQAKQLARVLVVGDTIGVPDLLDRLPSKAVVGIMAASIRPHGHAPLRALAQSRGVPLIVQPSPSKHDDGWLDQLAELQPDGLVCHSYAMRIGRPVLELVQHRAFNLHWSLLPRHRGPNPIQWTLIHGDARAGVTMHLMDDAFDRGPIVAQASIPVDDDDTWVSLHDRLATCAQTLLDSVLPSILRGTWSAYRQDEEQALHNPRITPDSFAVDFARMSDRQIANLIRAQVAPLSGAYLDTPTGRRRFASALTSAEVTALRRQVAPETL